MSSNFGHILTNWYLTNDKTSNEQEQDENVDGLYCNFIYSITFPFLDTAIFILLLTYIVILLYIVSSQ